MSAPPIIIVAGFGRCGTSLVMQMLDAGGIPCLGWAPAFEDPRTKTTPPKGFWSVVVYGMAVKMLDPHRFGPTALPSVDIPHRIIWLHRHHDQQAKSIAKFSEVMLGVAYSRDQRRALERQLLADRAKVRHLLAGRKVLAMGFEDLLRNPTGAAADIGKFIGQPFDALRAAAQVRQRGPECAPDLSMELQLMRGAADARLQCD